MSKEETEELLRQYALQEVINQDVKNVKFHKDKVSLEFDGEKMENKIVVVPNELWVGSWFRHKPVVVIDNDVPEQFRPSLAVHETIEKYVCQRYGLDSNAEGHELAEEVERRWFMQQGHTEDDWAEYSKIIERIHRKEFERVAKQLEKFSGVHKRIPKDVGRV
jgi:hypothetical protein